jgi:hypothetical protein
MVCFGIFGRESEMTLEAGNECRLKTSGSRDGGVDEVLTRFRGLEDSLRETGTGGTNDRRSWPVGLLTSRWSADGNRPRSFRLDAVGVENLASDLGEEKLELLGESFLSHGRTL